jgi:hypothetical protein
LCFNGDISPQLTLPFGTVADVQDEVAASLRFLEKDCGFIAASAKAIQPDVPMENAVALIDSLVNQDRILDQKSSIAMHPLRKMFETFHPESS